MRTGVIGEAAEVVARRRGLAPAAGLDGLDVAFVAGPTAGHFAAAEAATKAGRHVFLEWPPATSVREAEAMSELAEEAGVEVGVSRPLRLLPVFRELPEAGRVSLIVVRLSVSGEAPAWPRRLADAVDLCCALAQSHSVQRVDAEAVRTEGPWPAAVAFGLRFHSGAYAQVSLRRGTAGGTLYVGGAGFEADVALPDDAASEAPLLEAETQAFLAAVAEGRPAPVSILDGLHTLRLVERLMMKLR